jgi:hypothetical protein
MIYVIKFCYWFFHICLSTFQIAIIFCYNCLCFLLNFLVIFVVNYYVVNKILLTIFSIC